MFDSLKSLTKMQGELLRNHGCGHPQWYAENLVAIATKSIVMPTNFKDYDLESPDFGRIQVKSRVDGTDTSYNQNRTNFGKYELDVFDWAAVIIFTPDFKIDGAVMLKLCDIRPLVMRAGHVKWIDVKNHPQRKDLKEELVNISGET